jgi:hypothetical protein
MEQEEQARKDKMAAQAAKLAELQEAKRKEEEENEEKEEDGEEKKRREEEQQKVIIPPNKPDGPGISPLTPVHLCIVKMHRWKEDCTATKIPFIFSHKKKLRDLSSNFHIHVSVSDLLVHIFSCSRIGRSIVGIYKSVTDT